VQNLSGEFFNSKKELLSSIITQEAPFFKASAIKCSPFFRAKKIEFFWHFRESVSILETLIDSILAEV
jgi:hypothetical protein